MRLDRIAPRWVWVAWSSLMAALVAGLALWVVNGVVRGVPGPIIGGVYIAGAVDAAVVVVYVVAAACLTSVATTMAARVPGNRIGWILGVIAAWMVGSFFVIMTLYYLHSPTDWQTTFAYWLGNWSFVLVVPTSLVLMIFPTGHLPSRRWWIMPWLALAGTAGWAIGEATSEGLGLGGEIPNPYSNPSVHRVADALVLLSLPALVGTVASLVVRYRNSPSEGRLQIKWVALGGVLQVIVICVAWAINSFGPASYPVQAVLAGMLSLLIVPVALGVAILKYRLYHIDRVVSRTVFYTVLGALLAAVFVGGVIGTQALFGVTSDLAVAGTTLAVAAIFDPLRRRLHAVMDRRFDRRRFDIENVVEAFAARMGSVARSEDLAADLKVTLERTLAPASIGIWIRGESAHI